MAFSEYQHEKKYFPTSRPSTYSQFYQRAQSQHSQSPQSLYYPPPPHLNPNINYSSLAQYNNSLSNSSTSSSSSLSSTNSANISAKHSNLTSGLYNSILTDQAGKDLDFNLHSSGSNYYTPNGMILLFFIYLIRLVSGSYIIHKI